MRSRQAGGRQVPASCSRALRIDLLHRGAEAASYYHTILESTGELPLFAYPLGPEVAKFAAPARSLTAWALTLFVIWPDFSKPLLQRQELR